MTYREKYAERIASLTKDELIQEEIRLNDLITLYKGRLEICTNEKKVHDARVGLKRTYIRLDEINKCLIKTIKE